MITIPQRHRRTDGLTTCLGNTVLRYSSRGKNQHFPYPTPIRAKICGCSTLWSRPVMLGSAESQVPKLIIREIIFEFQRV